MFTNLGTKKNKYIYYTILMKNFLSNIRKSTDSYGQILYNRGVLYFLVFLSMFEMFLFMNTNDFKSLVVFISIGIVISYFNKNMIVILFTAIVLTNIVKYGVKKMFSKKHGYEKYYENFESTSEEENTDIKNNGTSIEDKTDKMSIKNEDADSMKKEDTKSKKNDKMKEYAELLKDLPEFKDVLQALYKMEPLIDKAENFISKYENYKNKN